MTNTNTKEFMTKVQYIIKLKNGGYVKKLNRRSYYPTMILKEAYVFEGFANEFNKNNYVPDFYAEAV